VKLLLKAGKWGKKEKRLQKRSVRGEPARVKVRGGYLFGRSERGEGFSRESYSRKLLEGWVKEKKGGKISFMLSKLERGTSRGNLETRSTGIS